MPRYALIHFNHTIRDGLVGWADMTTSAWKPNYGDMLVCSAILRQTNSHGGVMTPFGHTVAHPADLAIMRGSTYLHNNFDFDAAIKTIDSLQCPIACVGLGAQNPELDVSFLDNNKKAAVFVSKLVEKSKSISVRGNFSAEIVSRLGAKNVRVTGCPSLFYFGRPVEVGIPDLLRGDTRRIGISIHTGLKKDIFCRNPDLTFQRHAQVIGHAISNSLVTSIFEQGNAIEFLIANRRAAYPDRLKAASSLAAKIGLSSQVPIEQLVARFVSVLSIEEWLGKARDTDAGIGFRFHGNMVMLNQGIPCFYYVYDSRLAEFCEVYSLPYANVEDEFSDPVRRILDHDWSKVNGAIARCHDELQSFYLENGITV